MIGGSYAQDGQFPYHLLIEVNGKFRCGGSIISKKFALSAAHCFYDKNSTFQAYDVKVFIGQVSIRNRSTAKIISEVEKVYIPKEFNKDDYWYIKGDIAILRVIFVFIIKYYLTTLIHYP